MIVFHARLVSFVLLAFLSGIANLAGAVTYVPDNDGNITIEAEAYSAQEQKSHRWTVTSRVGALGAGMITAGPDDNVIRNVRYLTSSPRLDFDVRFAAAGKYYVWVRGIGANTRSNSIHIGLDGKTVSSSDRIDIAVAKTFRWSNKTMDGLPPSFVVGSAGLHTVNLWMGESGVAVDQIVLTSNPNFAPVPGVVIPDTDPISGYKGIVILPRSGANMVAAGEAVKIIFHSPQLQNIVINSLVVSTSSSNIDGVVSFADRTAIFTPSRPLSYNSVYTARIYAVAYDSQKNVAVPITHQWQFTTVDPLSRDVIFANNLDDERLGTYTETNLRSKWRTWSAAGVNEGRISIIPGDSPNQGNVLQIRYEAQKFGIAPGGVQWRTKLGSHEELYVSYWVKFAKNFDFVRGGKLPGLTGGQIEAYKRPSGYDFFMALHMFQPEGKGLQYIYHMDQPNLMADSVKFDVGVDHRYFIPGKWHKLETRVKLNTPGLSNGLVQTWFDGELAADRQNLRFRNTDSLKIDRLVFATFFGGSNSSWATSKTEYAYFDNVVVATKPITH